MTLTSGPRCNEGVCDSVTVTVKAAQDNIDDPSSVNKIQFTVLYDEHPMHSLTDVRVTVDSFAGAVCHVHTDSHIVTFDGAR